ncbi:MAG: hypothetical protein ACFCVK_10060 [Acidimicrobiales bacterium]
MTNEFLRFRVDFASTYPQIGGTEMTVAATLDPPTFEARFRAGVDQGLAGISDAALFHGGRPGVRVSNSIERLRRRQEAFAVWIVLIVAIAIVAVVGVMAYVAVVCINRGGSYAGGLSIRTNGWKVWEYKLSFKCTR